MQRTAAHCNALHRTAEHFSALPYATTLCNTLPQSTYCVTGVFAPFASHCCSVIQCDTVCCSTLRCVADYAPRLWLPETFKFCVQWNCECCSALQRVATRCSALQGGAVYCIMLQYVAVCCSDISPALCCDSLPSFESFFFPLSSFIFLSLPSFIFFSLHLFSSRDVSLQHTTSRYNTLPDTARYCNTLQQP